MNETPDQPKTTHSRRSFPRRAVTALVGAALLLSAGTGVLASQHAVAAKAAPRASGAIIVTWNKELLRILGTPGAQPATVHPTRSLAILHAAIYDAVDSITHSSPPYLFSLDAPAGARPEAAAAEAGHDTLAALYPSFRAALDRQLAGELKAIPHGAAKQEGIETGHLAAALILAARSDDGSSVAPPVLPAGSKPGAYRPTPPTYAQAAFTQWPRVTPFVLERADQFRPAPPPALNTPAYTRSLKQVKSLGRDTSKTRTAAETVSAKFWAGPPWISWNQIAEQSALAHHTDLVHTARLFALLNLSFADTVIAFYDAKYHYDVWRPITAIRDAAKGADPTWNPLLPTPADPAYPGAHSALSWAAYVVLASFYGDHNRIKLTSSTLPGVVLRFKSYSAAATDTGLSRIYGGVHYRFDHEAGLHLGDKIARFVLHQARSSAFGMRRT